MINIWPSFEISLKTISETQWLSEPSSLYDRYIYLFFFLQSFIWTLRRNHHHYHMEAVLVLPADVNYPCQGHVCAIAFKIDTSPIEFCLQ